MERWPLPEGWEWRSLKDVVSETERATPKEHPEQTFTYIEISNIENRTGKIKDPSTLLGKDAPSRARKRVITDDVLFATTRPYLRNIAVVPEVYNGEVCTTGFCVLRANQKLVSPKWVYHLTRSNVVIEQIKPLMHGASYPAVTDREVLSVQIPIPPLETQRRIVTRIEELFAELGEARRIHAALEDDAERLMDAALIEVFEGRKDWPIYELSKLATIKAKQVNPTLPEYRDLPHINGSTIEPITGQLGAYQTAAEDGMTSAKYHFSPGSVLYSKIRPYLRKATTVDFEGLCSADMYPLRVKQNTLSHSFLKWTLLSHPFTEYAIALSGRARMPKLNRKQLFAYNIQVPDLDKQHRIVAYLDEVQEYAAEIRHAADAMAADMDRLEQSILAQAFRGML